MKKIVIGLAAIIAFIWFINYRQEQRTRAWQQESQRNVGEFTNGFVNGLNEGDRAPGAAVRREIETYQRPAPSPLPKRTQFYDANGNPVGTAVQY